jgi:hypothetical protein
MFEKQTSAVGKLKRNFAKEIAETPPAMLAAAFAYMEDHVSLHLQMERN